MNQILSYYIIFLDDNASPEVVHYAFPVSKREGKKKRKEIMDQHILSHLAANKRNGTVEMRNLNNNKVCTKPAKHC